MQKDRMTDREIRYSVFKKEGVKVKGNYTAKK